MKRGSAGWPSKPATAVYGFVAVAVAVVVLFSSFVLAQQALPAEWWLAPITDTVGGIPVGRMSPLTALAFLPAAMALLCQLPPFDRWRLHQPTVAGLALVPVLIGWVIIGGYLSGTPLLYGGQTIPMAFVTALALAALGAGLLLAGGSVASWTHRLVGDAPAPTVSARASQTSPRGLFVLFLALTAAIGIIGFFYLRHQQADARRAMEHELSAIADLKVTEIVNWREERLADGRTVLESHAIADDVQQLLARPADAGAAGRVRNSMAALQLNAHYARVLLLDRNQRVWLSVPESGDWTDPAAQALAAQASAGNNVLISDLHVNVAVPDQVNMDVLVPLLGVPGAPGSAPEALGVLLLEIAPADFLYPLIRSWPTPSRTAKTLLVRREGGDVLYLNEPRHLTGAALKLRMPVNTPNLPATLALVGQSRVVEGVDYRKIAVLAALRAIPGSRSPSPVSRPSSPGSSI